MFNHHKKRGLFVFVESPNKVKVFEQVLSKKYKDLKIYVIATKGHIVDIKAGLIESYKQTLTINYKKYADTIANKMKNGNYNPETDLILLATDPDREGEAISWYVIKLIEAKFNKACYARIRCHSLTEANILSNIEANQNSQIDKRLIDAYFARVIIDMLIGINGSSLLWTKLYGCRSIGRVQSIVIYMLLEKEREIQQFVPKKYKKLSATLEGLDNIKVTKITYKGKCVTELEDSEKILIHQKLDKQQFKLASVVKKKYSQKFNYSPRYSRPVFCC